MRKLVMLLALVPMLYLLPSCQKELSNAKSGETPAQVGATASATECGTPVRWDLLDAGGVLDLGDVFISNTNENITVTVNTNGGLFLAKVTSVFGSQQHVSDAITSNLFWTACQGPYVFDVQRTHDPLVETDNIVIPNSQFQADGCVWIGVYVEVKDALGTSYCGYISPSAQQFGSAGWQSAVRYCRQECPPPPGDCGQLRTQTPGGWGAPPNGNNPGAYLHANFSTAFPGGLTVGCYPNNYYVRLTSAQAITDYLPAGATPSVLAANFTNPATKDLKNTLVSHLVSLTLSVGFDVNDPSFGQAGIALGDMEIGSGAFAGWTVGNFLAEANKVLGGCGGGYSIENVIETATKINENYVDGKTDKKYLVCPE